MSRAYFANFAMFYLGYDMDYSLNLGGESSSEIDRLSAQSRLKYILIKKEANKALLRSTSKEEPKMLEWIPNKEHPYSPLVILMI